VSELFVNAPLPRADIAPMPVTAEPVLVPVAEPIAAPVLAAPARAASPAKPRRAPAKKEEERGAPEPKPTFFAFGGLSVRAVQRPKPWRMLRGAVCGMRSPPPPAAPARDPTLVRVVLGALVALLLGLGLMAFIGASGTSDAAARSSHRNVRRVRPISSQTTRDAATTPHRPAKLR
jgi:hypothetical protein